MQEVLEREPEVIQHRMVSLSISMVDIPPTSQLSPSNPWWKQPWLGTAAQWAAFVGMVILFVVSRSSQHASEDFDLRTDKRIDLKLNPVEQRLTDKLSTVISRLDKLDQWKEDIQAQ